MPVTRPLMAFSAMQRIKSNDGCGSNEDERCDTPLESAGRPYTGHMLFLPLICPVEKSCSLWRHNLNR
jgi:hypothetical protein